MLAPNLTCEMVIIGFGSRRGKNGKRASAVDMDSTNTKLCLLVLVLPLAPFNTLSTTLFDLDDFLITYLDYLLIYSNTLKDHKQHVRLVLLHLQNAGLHRKLSKCEFHGHLCFAHASSTMLRKHPHIKSNHDSTHCIIYI